jgi:C-terminal processing protease CtpA/Prc
MAPEMLNMWSRAVPRGWFGFGFECDCVAERSLMDSVAVWTFSDYPRVYSVDDGSPAAKAGLRRGDVIKEIDGISILDPDGGRRFGSIRPGRR